MAACSVQQSSAASVIPLLARAMAPGLTAMSLARDHGRPETGGEIANPSGSSSPHEQTQVTELTISSFGEFLLNTFLPRSEICLQLTSSPGPEYFEYRRRLFLAGLPFPSPPTSTRPESYVVPLPLPEPLPPPPHRVASPESSLGKLEALLAIDGAEETSDAWRAGLAGVHARLEGGKRLNKPLKLGLVIKVLKAGMSDPDPALAVLFALTDEVIRLDSRWYLAYGPDHSARGSPSQLSLHGRFISASAAKAKAEQQKCTAGTARTVRFDFRQTERGRCEWDARDAKAGGGTLARSGLATPPCSNPGRPSDQPVREGAAYRIEDAKDSHTGVQGDSSEREAEA